MFKAQIITLPQIVNGFVGGWIVTNVYGSQYIYAIVFAGIFMLCGAISVIFVHDPGGEKIKLPKTI